MDHQQQLQSINEQKDEVEIETYAQSQLHFGLTDQTSSDSERENLIQRITNISRTTSVPTTILSSSSGNHNQKHQQLLKSKSLGHHSNDSNNRIHPLLTRRRSTLQPQTQRVPTLSRMFSSQMLLGKKILSRRLIPESPVSPQEPTWTPPALYDVDQAIDEMGLGKFQWTLFVILGFVSFAYGMEIMLVAFLLPILQKEFGISPLESTLVPLASILGSFVGAFVLSVLADKFGRKKIIIVGVVCTAISAMVSAFATDIYQESVARFFVGFFMKCGVVAVTLFAEFLPTKDRGKMLMLSQAFWTLGLMTSIGLAWITLTYLNWRWYVKLSTIPLWIATVGVIWKMPESAHYLSIAGETERCGEILQKISEVNGKDLPEGELLHGGDLHADKKQRGNVLSLFRGVDAEPLNTTLLLFVYVIYQCCYYGVIFVSVRYFAKLDSIFHLHHDLYWEMMLTTSSELPSIFIGYFLVDQGRALTINVSLFLYAIPTYLLVFMDFEFNQGLGITLLYFSRMFISVTGMGAGVYFLEYFPTHIRATALGLAVSISMVIKFGAIVIAEVLHIMIAMYIFGTLGIIAFIASLMLQIDWPETWFLLDH